MQSQFDLIIQPSDLFKFDAESHFIKYAVDEQVEKQGEKVRCRFMWEVKEIKEMIGK